MSEEKRDQQSELGRDEVIISLKRFESAVAAAEGEVDRCREQLKEARAEAKQRVLNLREYIREIRTGQLGISFDDEQSDKQDSE